MTVLHQEMYTSRVIKGSALLAECRELLRTWRPGETASELEARVLQQDVLSRNTAQRVHDVVTRVFAPRYLQDPENARLLQHLLNERPRGDWFRHVSLVLAARQDRLVRDAASDWLPRLRQQGIPSVKAADLLPFLDQAPTDRPWNTQVRERVTQGVIKLLTELGLLAEPRKGIRDLLNFTPSPLAVAWLAYDLHFRGLSDSAVTAHPDWRVWQLTEEAVRAELSDLAPQGLWIFQAAGSVVTIRWNHHTRQEAADALARLDVH